MKKENLQNTYFIAVYVCSLSYQKKKSKKKNVKKKRKNALATVLF